MGRALRGTTTRQITLGHPRSPSTLPRSGWVYGGEVEVVYGVAVKERKFFGTPPEQLQNDGGRSNAFGKAPIISISKLTTTDVSIGPVVGGYWDSLLRWEIALQRPGT